MKVSIFLSLVFVSNVVFAQNNVIIINGVRTECSEGIQVRNNKAECVENSLASDDGGLSESDIDARFEQMRREHEARSNRKRQELEALIEKERGRREISTPSTQFTFSGSCDGQFVFSNNVATCNGQIVE